MDKTPSRPLLAAAFAVYLALLLWFVLWKLEVPWTGPAGPRELKLIPFAPSAGDGPSAPLEVAMNVLVFVPFGAYLGLLLPTWRWWKATLIAAGASLLLEAAQYVLNVGSADVTDVIANSVGALAGFGLLAAVRRALRERGPAILARASVALTAIAVVACVAFLASPIHFVSSLHLAPGSGTGQAGRIP